MKMNLVRRGEADYPLQLLSYERMPEELYVIGKFPDPERPAVAIVGARKCSYYGWQEAFRFGEVLAAEGVQIISGMALGCDAAGHAGALKAGGSTFAVLGCGADVCYPLSNRNIYEQIPASGGIISEYEPGEPAVGWHFPIRNRIISAFADIVLVAEARKKSGSLITVEYALEQGKSVYAIPGRNRDPFSAGSNQLIAQGAGIAASPELLLEELKAMRIRRKPVAVKRKHAAQMLQKLRQPESGRAENDGKTISSERLREISDAPAFIRLADALDFDEKNVYTLAETAGCTPAEAGKYLLMLCRAGAAREVLPGYFCRV